MVIQRRRLFQHLVVLSLAAGALGLVGALALFPAEEAPSQEPEPALTLPLLAAALLVQGRQAKPNPATLNPVTTLLQPLTLMPPSRIIALLVGQAPSFPGLILTLTTTPSPLTNCRPTTIPASLPQKLIQERLFPLPTPLLPRQANFPLTTPITGD